MSTGIIKRKQFRGISTVQQDDLVEKSILYMHVYLSETFNFDNFADLPIIPYPP